MSRYAETRRRIETWAIAPFLLVAIGVVYGQTLWFRFLNYDDNLFIYECAPVRPA